METHFDELLDFPCLQNFKVMGVAHEDLPVQVITKLQSLAPGDYAPTIRQSRKGNYHAFSVAVTVTSKDHMETIYTEISKLDLVRFVL